MNSLPAFARRQQNDLQVLGVGFGRCSSCSVHSGLEDCETHRKVTVLSTVAVTRASTKSLCPFEWQYSPALIYPVALRSAMPMGGPQRS